MQGTGDAIVNKAREKIRCDYKWGAAGPSTFDCSGLSQWAHQQVGINIPRTSSDQASKGANVDFNSVKPGDLVFFDTSGKGGVSHVGIVSKSGYMIHAPTTNEKVKEVAISKWWTDRFKKAKRYW